jgi:ubiquinone/menaquinone biosynthesis C-methylase UbiE
MRSVFDKHYKRYDTWYKEHWTAFYSEIKAIEKVLPRNKKGLEIGVGTGRFAMALGIRSGIDPSEKMLALAKKRGVQACVGTGENLPFRDRTFDYVAVIITLCFVRDPRKVIREAYRVLKTRGKIIIGIVDKQSFLGKFYQMKKSVFYKAAHFFTPKQVTALLKAAGFDSFKYYQTITDLPHKIAIVEEPRKGFGKGGFVVISATK